MDSAFLAAALGAWAGLELGATLGMRWLHRVYRIVYAPRDRPALSPFVREFLEAFVRADGIGETKRLCPELGWTHAAGARSRDGLVRIGPDTARIGEGPAASAALAPLHIATFGDCLVFGGAVRQEETWQSRLESDHPGWRISNFGVEGYDVGQSVLRYEQQRASIGDPGLALIGVASSNIPKILNAFRPFYAHDYGLPLAKPSFSVEDGQLKRIANPLPTVCAYEKLLREPEPALRALMTIDHYGRRAYRRRRADVLPSIRLLRMVAHETSKRLESRTVRGDLREGSLALRTTTALLDRFQRNARTRGTKPAVLLLPLRAEADRFLRTGRNPNARLLDALDRMGLVRFDLLEAFVGERSAGALYRGRHFSPEGHRVIAGFLEPRLYAVAGSLA